MNVLVRFTVRDTGVGIRPEDIEKLFSNYTQLDTGANRKIEGSGLGLPITKSIAEMMGGSIAVASEYGKGSVFTAEIIQSVELQGKECPCIGEETAENLRNFRYVTELKDDIAYSWMPHGKALVVDDVQANLQVARGLLAPYGLQIDTAASGQDAIEMVRDRDYDIIFMDHMMPEMDGAEAAAAIRETGKGKNNNGTQLSQRAQRAPIIAMTANALRGMKEYYLEHGFDDYLSKPIDPRALDEVINKWIGNGERRTSGSGQQASVVIPRSLEPLIEEQRLDMLNHYRMSFNTIHESQWQAKFDPAYFARFAALVNSFDTADMAGDEREQAAVLTAAARKEDARQIRETIGAFCEALHKRQDREKEGKREPERKTVSEMVARLEKALLAGEIESAEAVIAGMGVANLTAPERELYFQLYALMLDGDTEKILGVIKEKII